MRFGAVRAQKGVQKGVFALYDLTQSARNAPAFALSNLPQSAPNAIAICCIHPDIPLLFLWLCYHRELEPGLGISRLEAADFSNFLSVASLFTGFVHIKNHGNKDAAPPSTEPAVAVEAEGGLEPTTATVTQPQSSPFACLSATMGWETFRMVHILWINQLEVPPKSDAKDWALQVWIVVR